MKRDTTISIAKGIAIILMVIAHAEAPGWLCQFIFEFHMPLFFITAGYFFSLKYLNDEATFVKKRIKGLYWPFWKWAVFFLIIHNWMFDLGILNEVYGNETGGVTHPYTWHQIQQNLWNITTAMGGYDQFLCGAFWFFIALIFVTIAYAIIRFIGRKLSGRIDENITVSAGVLFCFVLGCVMRYTVNIPRFSPALTLVLFYHLGNLYYVNRERISFNNGFICSISFMFNVDLP